MSLPTSGDNATSRYRLPANLTIGASQSGGLAASRMVFSLVALQLAATPWQAGLLVALFGVFPSLFMVHLGRWMDRIGTFPVSVLTTSGALLVCLLAAWAPTMQSMMLAAPFIGMAAVVAHVASVRALGTDDDLAIRARNLGYLGACYAFAHFLAPLGSGIVLDSFGSNAAFLILALLPALSLSVLLVSDRHTVAPIAPREPEPDQQRSFMTLLRMPALRRWLLANGTFNLAMTMFPFVAALHAESANLSAATTGWMIGAAAIGTLVIRAGMRQLVSAIRPLILLAVALFLTGVSYAVLPFFTDIRLLIVASFFLGLSMGGGMPVVNTMIYTESPQDRIGESLGLGTSISMLFQTISPLILGLLASLWGVKTMASVLGALFLLTAWDAYGGSRRQS